MDCDWNAQNDIETKSVGTFQSNTMFLTYAKPNSMGTINMEKSAVRGEKFNNCFSVRKAYANAPIIPAPPVPDDQLVITLLWKCDERASKVMSPRPAPKDAKTTPNKP
jgi:hypothetical protein